MAARILPSHWRAAAVRICYSLTLCLLSAASVHAQRVPAPQLIAPGVFAIIGAAAQAAPDNHGAVGNQGILIGNTGVILIDTGTSFRYGVELIAAVRSLTDKPIVLVINTHQHPAFIFGNGALLLNSPSHSVPILAHREAAALIRQRCAKCLANLKNILGADEMAGTEVTVPSQLVDGETTMTVAGRRLQIVYFGTSSSPGSIGVIDVASGVMFAGGLVTTDRVPDVKDARIPEWLRALAALKQKNLAQIVPGEGPVSAVDQLDIVTDYLSSLQNTVAKMIGDGISLADAPKHGQLSRFEKLPLYQTLHDKNIAQVYLQMERTALRANPVP